VDDRDALRGPLNTKPDQQGGDGRDGWKQADMFRRERRVLHEIQHAALDRWRRRRRRLYLCAVNAQSTHGVSSGSDYSRGGYLISWVAFESPP
jgi:hypothetical protein